LAKKLEQAEATNQQQAEELRNARAAHEIRGRYIEELKQNSEHRDIAGKPPVMGYRVKEAISEFQGATPVVVLDLKMGFFSMIWFMVKWALASIPALIILVFIGTFIFGILAGVLHRG